MLLDELKTIVLNKALTEFRKFGITFGSFLVILEFVLYFISEDFVIYLLVSGCLFLITGFLFPVFLRPFYILWMSFGSVMGFFVTRLILSLLYFLIFTPIGFLLRIFNVKLLEQEIEPQTKSYWKIRSKKKYEPADSEKQY